MVFGVRGHCGQRAQPAAARGLGRGSGHATVHLLKMAVNLVAAPRNKLVTAATDPAQVRKCWVELKIFKNSVAEIVESRLFTFLIIEILVL